MAGSSSLTYKQGIKKMINLFETGFASTTPKQHNLTQSLGKATQNILYNAFYLAKQKLELSCPEYKQLLREWGWEKEDKKYLKVAQTFEKFSPLDLAEIEPDTLFLLSKQNKKYASVIKQLLDIGCITQEKVRQLIKLSRKPKTSKPKKPSIWRRDHNGLRYCQIPPIDDQNTGVALQRMIDSEGLSAQQIVSEAIALRQAFIEGRLNWVSDSQETLNMEAVKVESSEDRFYDESLENEDVSDHEPIIEIDNLSEDHAVFSDSIIVNPITTQETVETLSDKLFAAVENINHFGINHDDVAEQLVKSIISFCNAQPISEQWNTLAEISRRNSNALMIVIRYSDKNWFFNLPQLLADAALKNPLELDWVDKQLLSKALLLISNSTDDCSRFI